MPRILDILFFVLMVMACVGVDFVIMKFDRHETNLTVASYITQRTSDINNLLNPPKLVDLLPNEIQGWQMGKGQSDQPIVLNGGDQAEQENEITLIKTIAQLYQSIYPNGEYVHLVLGRENTNLRFLLFAPNTTAENINNPASGLPKGASALLDILNTVPNKESVFTVIKSISFIELPINTILKDPDIRLLRADVGNNMIVFAVTKSTDDAVIKLALHQLDLSNLQTLWPKGNTAVSQIPPPAALQDAPSNAPAQPEPIPEPAAQPAEIAQPTEAPKANQPCVRRAGVLVCAEE